MRGDRARRRECIAELVSRGGIGSQAALARLLGERGIEVTQATLSRDLRDLGVVKGAGGYTLAPPGSNGAAGESRADRGALAATLRRYVRELVVGGTLVVIRTGPGQAGVVGLELDRASLRGVLGSIAGDDTVFVAAASAQRAASLARELRKDAGLA